jgi:DNA polymerase-3 subunit epsilon/ATP-dependent DNA helicase DinG
MRFRIGHWDRLAGRQRIDLINKPSQDQVYWVEVRPSGNGLSLNAAPLRVGPLIEKVLWHEKASVILTSATLTTHGEFHYIRNTLGADEADEIQLGSPFDYESSTLLYVANDIPEPNSSDYQHALHRGIVSAATAAGGRTLALFTSYAALRKAAQAIAAPLAREDILVYEHGEGASPNVLLESFKSTERAVCWEPALSGKAWISRERHFPSCSFKAPI